MPLTRAPRAPPPHRDAPQLVAPPRRQYAKAVLDDAKRRMIVQLRWMAMQAKARRDTRQRRTVAELDAEKAALRAYVNKYVARRRAVNILHVLAADKYKGGSLELSIKCLDAMRRLSQYDSSTYMIVEHGGMNAALEAMENYPKSADVQWHACTLFGNLGLSLVLLVRLHLHPEVKHGRTALLIIRAIAEFPHDVRVQGASCGALWTLVMAIGKAGQELAIRGGAVPLLVAAVKKHPHSGIVVYNACGALLTIAQGFPDVQTILQGDGSTRVLKEAMDKHGGIEHMYGTWTRRARRALRPAHGQGSSLPQRSDAAPCPARRHGGGQPGGLGGHQRKAQAQRGAAAGQGRVRHVRAPGGSRSCFHYSPS
jgi:hypothetical protein